MYNYIKLHQRVAYISPTGMRKQAANKYQLWGEWDQPTHYFSVHANILTHSQTCHSADLQESAAIQLDRAERVDQQ